MKKFLYDLVIKSKNNNKESKETILIRYKPLINKVLLNYYVKGYEREDLEQMVIMWILIAIEKYDLNKNSNFDSYIFKAVNNNIKALIRKVSLENYNKSIEDIYERNITIGDSLRSDYNLEDIYIQKDTIKNLRVSIDNLSKDEKKFLEFIFFKNGGNLSYWSRKNNISYNIARNKKEKILNEIRIALVG